MLGPVRAIVWAQWRAQRNFVLGSHKTGIVFSWLSSLLWYGLWAGLAAGAALLTGRGGGRPESIELVLGTVLFFNFFFWQMFPIVLASSGAFLDVKRLLVYPIPPGQLFLLELALRVSTGLEMLLVLLGLCAGAAWNPGLPWWAPLALLAFGAFNLLLSSGLKTLLERMLQRRWVREILVGCLLLLLVLPQLVSMNGLPAPPVAQFEQTVRLNRFLPWKATALLAAGQGGGEALALLGGWIGLAYWFARAQFARALRLEEFSAATPGPVRRSGGRLEWLYRAPALLFRDPLAAVIEKELRLLARSPRFRLMLLMSCVLSPLLFLPFGMRSGNGEGFVSGNYLTLSMSYVLMTLSDILLWNIFGMERGAAQTTFVTPIGIRTVLHAKNLVAALVLFLCLLVLTATSTLLPVPVDFTQFLEAAGVLAVTALVLLGVGNLSSIAYPRAVDPNQMMRNSSGGMVNALLLLLYPVLSIPISLAYLARWALDSQAAFFAVLAVDLLLAGIIYWVATDAALEAAEARKEQMIAALTASQREGPISIR